MKKFLLCLLLVTVCLACLVACGGDDTTTEITTTEKPVVTTPVVTTDKGTDTPAPSGLEDAKAYLVALYKDQSASTPVDYELIGALRVAGVAYTLEWSVGDVTGVTVTRKDATTVLVDVIDRAEADIPYTLTATITDKDGNSTTVAFERKVPMFKENTFAEYAAAKNDELIIVKGVVSGIIAKSRGNSSNCLYVQDTDGGYYVYGLEKDPVTDLHIELGMTVRVTGKKDNYNGTFELKNASVEILNEGAKTDVVAKDLTDAFKAATDLKAAELVGIQGMYVTLKGVTVGELGTNGYHYFTLGNLTTYVRISSSTCPLAKAEQTAFTSAWESHFGWTADIAGVISVYDGKFYLTPCVPTDANFLSLPELDDAGKVALEKDALSFVDFIGQSGELTVPVAGATYTDVVVSWAADNACLTFDGAKLTVKLPAEITKVKVTATIKSGDVTETKDFEVTVDAAALVVYTPVVSAKPEAGKTYKYALNQAGLGQLLFFNGKMDGYYLGTTDNVKLAVDVTIEAVEGGFRFSFMDGDVKKYIDIIDRDGSKVNVTITETPSAVFVYDASLNIYTATVNDKIWYLGTYGTYNTMSASETWRITGENASAFNTTQFASQFYEMVLVPDVEPEEKPDPTPNDEPIAKSPYKFVLAQNNVAKMLYLTGEVDGRTLVTTTDISLAADVYVEESGKGYIFAIFKEGTKLYIELYINEDGKAALRYSEDATVFTYDAWRKAWITTVNEVEYFLGNTFIYSNVYACLSSYLTEENSGVKQFTAVITPYDTNETIKPDTAFKFGLYQGTVKAMYYLDGGVSGKFLTTTDSVKKAIDVYAEEYHLGGYKLYTIVDDEKLYIEIAGGACAYVEMTECVYNYDTEINAWVADINGTDYYLGTYSSYTTVSASKTSYINPDNTGVSQFPAGFVTVYPPSLLSGPVATFDFGAKGSAAHVDGNDYGASKSFTADGYTLALTSMSKVFGPAMDAKGNSCIKLGTSSKVGTFEFTVPADVTSVIINVAKYKANTTKIQVNGVSYTINTASNNGEYTAIEIDTSVTKTVTFTTVSGGVRCMIDSIVFVG